MLSEKARGHTAEAKSSDAPERGGLTRGSEEAAVMAVERRGGVTDAGTLVKWETMRSQWKCEHPAGCSRWHEPYDSRGSRTVLRGAVSGRQGCESRRVKVRCAGINR